MKNTFFSLLFIFTVLLVKSQTSPAMVNTHGKYLMYYKSGSIKAKGNYLNNKREGEWIYYHENGSVALKKNFSNGIQIGEWIYYNPDGTPAMKVDDISKISEKVEITRYEQNKVKYKSTFVNGKNVGSNEKELNNKF